MMRSMLARISLVLLIISLISVAPITYADAQFAKRKDVNIFVKMMVKKHHFNRKRLIALFREIKIKKQVAKKVFKPLEKEPWELYQVLFVNEWRIEHGVKYWNKHAETLQQAEKLYGVPASIIVATLGIETKYGQKIGGSRVIDVLGNLAFNHKKRQRFFRKELESFLILTQKYRLDPLKIMGSYAGAIGKPQFMPSSYLNYGIKFAKKNVSEHKKNSGSFVDLIHNEEDTIASIANYYHKHGWHNHQPVAVRAYMLNGRNSDLIVRMKSRRAMTLAQLSKYGVMPKYRASADKTLAKLIELKGHEQCEYWLGFHNFDVIKRYNSSNLYAMAVYQLSNYIQELREKLNNE